MQIRRKAGAECFSMAVSISWADVRLNDIFSVMKKISLNVLLRFLSKYSHWNLIRRADGYHLYFIAHQQGDVQTGKTAKHEKKRNRKLASVSCNKIRKGSNTTPGKQRSKDVFVFNPIFNNIEDGVSVGLDSAVERSRRSSVSSFIWDDFLPTYKDEERLGKTVSDSESSGRSTPVQTLPSESSVREESQEVKEKFYEASMLQQGDRLLKEMLQLRKDLEKEKLDFELSREDKDRGCSSLLPNYGPLEYNEENLLREKLEMMTQQIKREMEDQFNRKHAVLDSEEEEKNKIRNIFKSLFQVKNNEEERKEISNEETLQSAIDNLLMNSESSETTFEEAQKQFKSKPPVEAKKKGKAKNQTKQVKVEEKQIVEIPFCSHPKTVKDLQSDAVSSNDNDKEVITGKADQTLLLTPDEKIAAEEILRELVDIRNTGGERKDPVVDTMIR